MTLVYVHGTGGSPRVWDRVRTHVDSPGVATTLEPEPGVTIRGLADDLLNRFDDALVIVGHSLGAMIAQEAAITRPDRVAGLVLCNSIPGADDHVRQFNTSTATQVEDIGIEAMLAPLHGALFPPGYDDAVALELFDADAIACGPTAFAAALRAIAAWTANDRLGSIGCPTTVIAGALETNVEAQRLLADLIGAPIEILDGVAHMTPLERPEAIAHAVGKILSTV